jgi:protein-arginine kinase activator protein McsA
MKLRGGKMKCRLTVMSENQTPQQLREQVNALKKKRDRLREEINERNWYDATVVDATILRDEIEELEKELRKGATKKQRYSRRLRR